MASPLFLGLAGTRAPSFDVQHALTLGGQLDVTFTGGQVDDFSDPGVDVCTGLAVTLTADTVLTGVESGSARRLLYIFNRAINTNTLTLLARSGSSFTQNWFSIADDVDLEPGEGILFMWAPTSGAGNDGYRAIGLYKDFASLIAAFSATLGTAAFLDVPAVGNASAGEVVLGSDARLGVGNHLIIQLGTGPRSTKFDASTKRRMGGIYFDPTLADWGTSGSSTITFYALLETTHASFPAQAELYQQDGTGSPTIIAATGTTASTTADLVSVDVSAAFRLTGNAGLFVPRFWLPTADGTQQATCSAAWLDIEP